MIQTATVVEREKDLRAQIGDKLASVVPSHLHRAALTGAYVRTFAEYYVTTRNGHQAEGLRHYWLGQRALLRRLGPPEELIEQWEDAQRAVLDS